MVQKSRRSEPRILPLLDKLLSQLVVDAYAASVAARHSSYVVWVKGNPRYPSAEEGDEQAEHQER